MAGERFDFSPHCKFDPATMRWNDATDEQSDDEYWAAFAEVVKRGRLTPKQRAEALEVVAMWRMRLEVTGCKNVAEFNYFRAKALAQERATTAPAPEKTKNADPNLN